jgi:cbb3-type cytochrome oxidase subunit 3
MSSSWWWLVLSLLPIAAIVWCFVIAWNERKKEFPDPNSPYKDWDSE